MNSDLTGLLLASYARYSSDKQRAASVEDQQYRIRKHISENKGVLHSDMEFSDRAESGQVPDRSGFERLLAFARDGRVQVILMEDVGRLYRGEAGFFPLLAELEYIGVRIIGIADGTDSADPNARLTLGIRGILNAQYVRNLADKTLRGLEGRARHGFSTGGRALGYRSKPVAGPDGQPIGFRLYIDEEEAETVRLIFTEYAAGRSLITVARQLTRLGRPTARKGSKYTRLGWSAGSVRAILHNERYRGRWSFNRRKWVRPPGTGRREPRNKDVSAHVQVNAPELRIVSDELWEQVQKRLAAVRTCYTRDSDGQRKGKIPGFTTSYPLSGLLVCGVCGAPMVIRGSDTRIYGCGNFHKGRACTNSRNVRERVVREKVMEAMRKSLTGTALAYILKRAAQRLDERQAERPNEQKQAEVRVANLRRKAERLAAFIAEGQESSTVTSLLMETEAAIRQAELDLAAVQTRVEEEPTLPSPESIMVAATDLATNCKKDPVRARERLRGVLRDGRIVLDPQPDGTFIARFHLLPLAFAQNENAAPKWPQGGVVYDGCCGGRI